MLIRFQRAIISQSAASVAASLSLYRTTVTFSVIISPISLWSAKGFSIPWSPRIRV